MRQGFFVSKTQGAVKNIFFSRSGHIFYGFGFRLLTFSVFMAAKQHYLKNEVM
jgi:hypothetical protein